jgi:hypothetical protein
MGLCGQLAVACGHLRSNCADFHWLSASWFTQTAATAETAVADLHASVAKQAAAAATELAEDNLTWCMGVIAPAISHDVASGGLHRPSALALAAMSAGPGSKLQRRLCSLLCSMVKLGRGPGVLQAPETAASAYAAAQGNLVDAAAITAAVLMSDVACLQQACWPVGDGGSGGSLSGAAAMLPNVFILGRCCLG